ncbi:MAG: 2-hydroxychromene-2-carboxylate isomerase [Sulfitobacter sp.]
MALREIEYFYSTHSAFAYIGSSRLREISARHGCRLIHRPFALSPVVEAAGGASFAGRTQRHVDYFFGREIERWAAYRGVPIIDHRPTYHDKPLALSSGMMIRAQELDLDMDALAHALLEAHWRDDIDLTDEKALTHAATNVGIDAAPLLEKAMSTSVQDTFAKNTQEAIERGFFGSPTYILNGDMFYGQDHLELLEQALNTPFPAPGFRNPPVNAL